MLVALSLIFVLPLLVALLLAHLHIVQIGEDYVGRLALVDRLFDLCLVIGILAVAFCVGRRLARLLSLSFLTAAEEVSFSVMMGVGCIGLVVLSLGLAGLLSPVPVLVAGGLLMLLTWKEWVGLLTTSKQVVVSVVSTKRRLILSALFLGLVMLLVLRSMTPPHSPDEAIYHLSVAKRFVERGRVFPVVDNWAGNMPLLIQMIYAVCLVAKSEVAAKLLSAGLAVICSIALFAFAARFLTRRDGVVAMFGLFGAGMIVEVAITSRIDVSLAGMLFLAFFAMATFFETGLRGWLYASALLSGFSVGIKYSGAIYVSLLGVMFLFESGLRKKDRAMTVIRDGALYFSIVAAVASPWLIKNMVWFGNPVYPFITGEVAEFSPAGLRYFGPEDQVKLDAHFKKARKEMPALVADRESQLSKSAARRLNRDPLFFWEYFTKPDAYNMGEDFHYPNYLFLFAPLIVLGRFRWLAWLGVLSVMFFLAATLASWVARLLVPAYPGLTLISVVAITELAARIDRRARTNGSASIFTVTLPALAVALAVGSAAFFGIRQSMRTNDLSFIAGKLSRSDYMKQFYYVPPSRFINSLADKSRVMLIGAQTSYELNRDYIADVNWDSTEWRRLLIRNNSIEEVNEDLKRRGVTHVWVAYGLFTFVAEMGRENYPNLSGLPTPSPDYQAQTINWATLDQYSTGYLEPIYNDAFGNIVYRIK